MSFGCYEIDELLNEAIITGVPAVIVEGIDDISIYDEISNRVPFDVEVYAVENIDGFNEGCEAVISALEDLNSLPDNPYPLCNHILGVIDKDVRDFRQEIPEVEPLLVLKYYSIESHFVSEQVISNVLKVVSKANQDLISEDLCKLMMDEIQTKILDLYYFSLESLRKSLDSNYSASFLYSYTPGRIRDQQTKQEVLAKRNDLDVFASSLDITPCINSLKSISKGKWLIDIFSQELLNSINNLQERCRDASIETCKSCISEAHNKCLYRMRDGFSKRTIQSLILSSVEGAEVQYIEDRILNIKGTA